MKQIFNESQQIKESSLNPINSGNSIYSQFQRQESQNNIQSLYKFPNKMTLKAIGIYNFKSNKCEISSLQERVNEVVSLFVEENKENIIKYVANEVQNKLNEKIEPLNSEINDIKNNFNLLYNEEVKNFKELDILNDCHNGVANINNKVGIMKENINKYIDEIKGFNIADNKLQFLNKLNNNLEYFINGINNENKKYIDFDVEEEKHKIDIVQKNQNNFNQELDNIFKETLSLLNTISNEEKYNLKNSEIYINILDLSNNLKSSINDFENKFNYENPIFEEQKRNANINNKKIKDNKNNIIDTIPNFFDLDL